MKEYLSKDTPTTKPEIEELLAQAKKNAQLEILNWAMLCCGHGYTTGMLRKVFHNRFVEISGEGERA